MPRVFRGAHKLYSTIVYISKLFSFYADIMSMINKRELRDFFKSDIEPYISTIEDDIKLEKNLVKMMIGISIFLGLLLFSISHKFNAYVGGIYIDDFLGKFIFLVPIGIYAVYYLIQKSNELDIDKSYEKVVIEPLIKKLALKYHKTRGFNNIEFAKSHLFTGYDKYKSNRLFSGYLDGSYIKFANIELTKGVGDNKVSIFHGLFIATKMKKSINGRVVVYPDYVEKSLGILGRGVQGSKMNGLERVLLDSPEFEREFVVYADDKIEANYILTHSMMERLTKLSSGLKKNYNKLYISFVGDNIYVAIHDFGFLDRDAVMILGRSLVVDFEHIEHHLDKLDLVLGLSKDLNLESIV